MNEAKSYKKLTDDVIKYKLLKNRFSVGILIFFLILITFLPCLVKGQSNIPEPTNLKYVNDYIGAIDNETKNYIVSLGTELEEKTGAQMTIVIINSLEGRDIESYANELFRTWGVGQKDKDNGLLILLSMQDRKWRVEVGRGLEGVITDIYSARVMDNIAKPLFAQGKFSEGLKNAYSVFASDVAKEYNVTLENYNGSNNVSEEKQIIRVNPKILYFIIGLLALDILLNRARITRFLFYTLFWLSFWGRGSGGGGGFGGSSSNGGGFGGGNSGGGGSSGSW